MIDENKDPYKNEFYKNIDDHNILPPFIKKQYFIIFDNYYMMYDNFFNENIKSNKRDASKIKYPYADGKYELTTLEDEKGEFL